MSIKSGSDFAVDSTLQESFKLRQCQDDTWTTREHLCLTSAVSQTGDQNWVAVSRALRLLTTETGRPPDWYSTKNCALQYAKLLEHIDIPKRKREKGDTYLNETPDETITKMLSKKRIEELKGILEEERASYEQLRKEIQHLESNQLDNRLHQYWEEIICEQDIKDEESRKLQEWSKEREEKIKIFQAASKPQSPKGLPFSSPKKSLYDSRGSTNTLSTKIPRSFPEVLSEDKNKEEEMDTEDAFTSVPDAVSTSLNSTSNNNDNFKLEDNSIPNDQFMKEENPASEESAINNINKEATYIKTSDNMFVDMKSESFTENPEVITGNLKVIKTESTVEDSEYPRTTEDEEVIDAYQIKSKHSSRDLINLETQRKSESCDSVLENVKRDAVDELQELGTPTKEYKESLSIKKLPLVSKAESDEISSPNVKSILKNEEDKTYLQVADGESVNEDGNLNKKSLKDYLGEDKKVLEGETCNQDRGEKKTPVNEDKKSERISELPSNEDVNKESELKGKMGSQMLKVQSSSESASADKSSQSKQRDDEKHTILTKEKIEQMEELDGNSGDIPKKRGRKKKGQTPIGFTSNKEGEKIKLASEKTENLPLLNIKEEIGEDLSNEVEIKDSSGADGLKTEYKKEKISFTSILSSSQMNSFHEKLGKENTDDDKKRKDEEAKFKGLKKEVKDEYEFDDDVSRESTDVKDFMMSRGERRKHSLGESVSSPVVSESTPSSPASTNYGDDPENEKVHRSWKRSIMLVWNDIAAHKNASIFLRPITEDKVPGYHSIVFKPIDLLSIKRSIENGTIRTSSDFQRDTMLMFLNAKMYNKKDHNVYRMANNMMKDAVETIEEFNNAQLLARVIETPQKTLRRETRESSAKRVEVDMKRKREDREEKPIKRRKI